MTPTSDTLTFSLPLWAGSVRLAQAAGPAARLPQPTGSAVISLLLKQFWSPWSVGQSLTTA
ncbi:BZ3500_MvSof-1268-A1-R1_Chr5-2g07753 [Microbotryum saponariae]|uniref:BZ3500_MvSof-1268-A1-R1_Chr5-2g07753 protein n=1 Tax=Microbotryum saponariae TaxID=289078 RepID=A0A2X0MJ65_9BASI|nr:BZ3500_MvSof-1268-A1-R1_Chr5-2g07753 [Microbotryum saponariae]SDA05622.1 BZ3501_MvSof-1269-A2-R1_Chr5-2g07575 [Microbotryum saponariae]